MMKKIFIATAALAAFTAIPAAAQSTQAGANPRATANARLIKPLTLTAVTDLNFGTIVMGTLTANETVAINGAGTVTCGSSGNLTCTGSPQSASYRITGTQGQTVAVSSTAASFPLSGSNGGTLNFVPTFPASVLLTSSGASGTLFNVGGSVVIGSATVDGVYAGEIDIQVAYQ